MDITLTYGGESPITLTSTDGPTLTLDQTAETYVLDGGLAGPAGAAADKNYTENFTNQSVLVVNHYLNKYPSVTILDTSHDEVVGQIEHLSVNSLQITFSASFSGSVTCN